MPKVRLPEIRLPEIRPPDLSWFRLPEIPAPVLYRVGKVVAVTAMVAGVVAVNPLRWTSKISLPKFSLPKIAKADSSRSSTQTPKRSAKKAKASPAKVQAKAQAPQPKPQAVAQTPAPVQVASVSPIGEPLKPPAPPTMTLLATQPLELAISANRTTWIQVRADGKLLTQQRLSRGAKERWTAKKQFEIVISKPNQVDVSLNGQSIGPLTVAHQGRVLITHQGITKLPERE
jgi:hypothetical protein